MTGKPNDAGAPNGSFSVRTPVVSSFDRSIELDPSSALSHVWLGFCAWRVEKKRHSPR
jgi:hypothetical protein